MSLKNSSKTKPSSIKTVEISEAQLNDLFQPWLNTLSVIRGNFDVTELKLEKVDPKSSKATDGRGMMRLSFVPKKRMEVSVTKYE